MNNRFCQIIIFVLLAIHSLKAQTTNSYDLYSLGSTGGIISENRTISPLTDDGVKSVQLSAQQGDGVAWLKDILFSNGIIELDIRGKNLVQQSFVGIAFHGMKKDSLEAIYFRPFNFNSTDSTRKSHAVEYVFHPDFPWERLRKENPGIYEKGIDPAPKPDYWFHVKIVVHYPEIKVYVNNSLTPSLTVQELNSRQEGKIGLWVGNNSGGDFANLKISH